MFDRIRAFLGILSEPQTIESGFCASDLQLAQAALMFRIIAADGIIHDEERDKLLHILQARYDLSHNEAEQLMKEAQCTDAEAIDLYAFTSILKRDLSEDERLELVESLWEMVFSDGEVHELEDNVVWRAAELLAVDKRARMEAKRKIHQRTKVRDCAREG